VENFQQADGSVRIPPPLIPYMGGRAELHPPQAKVKR
jgi:seryl-tRNA synthetase